MAYTITYKFGSALDVGEYVSGGHMIRMSIAFTVEGVEQNSEKFARDYGIKIADWGELLWERDLSENFMVPGRYNFRLFDGDGELKTLLFQGPLVPSVHKDGFVTLEIKYNGDQNYTTEYTGFIDNLSIEYDVIAKKISFSAFPKTDLLKNLFLYKDSADESGFKIGLNPLSIPFTNTNDIYYATERNVKTLIHDIFKQINPNCTLSWQHNWLFSSEYNSFLPSPPKLDQLSFTSDYLSALFFSIENPYGIETVDDLLKELAFDFGFVCGMITSDKAFVKNIFYYDANNTQTLGTVKKHIIQNKYGDSDAVRILSRKYVRDTRGGKNVYLEWVGREAVLPADSQLRGNNIIDKEIKIIGNSVGLAGSSYCGDMQYTTGGNTYIINRARVPYQTGGAYLTDVICQFYYALRNRGKIVFVGGTSSTIGREDQITVKGINYDYLKDFTYDGNKYQIVLLRKFIARNTSEISALVIGEAMDDDTPDNITPPPKPFTNVLPGGYLKDYSYNAEITIADVNAGSATLFTIPAGFELKKIILKINTKFDTLTTIKISDNDGDLITNDRIINENDEVIESFQYKNYPSQKTITATITKSGTCTAGDADVIFEVRTRL